jgi:hypothetical protein
MPSHEPDELIQAILEQRFVPLRLVAGNSCLHSAAWSRHFCQRCMALCKNELHPRRAALQQRLA